MTKSAKDRDRARAMAKPEVPEAEPEADEDEEDAEETPAEAAGSKVIVIHMGSQNLRIGLSSDALPKTVPMVIARKSQTSESEDQTEPKPKRQKREDGSVEEPELLFGSDVCFSWLFKSARVSSSNMTIVVFSFWQDVG